MTSQIRNLLLSIAFATSATAAASCSGGEWDVIVVGSGPGGIVTAARMSEAGKKTLLIEQGGPSYYVTGGRSRPDWLSGSELSRVDVPGLYKSIFSNVDSSLMCSHDTVNALQGCTVGGNTAINAGLFFQPPASDWDRYFPDGWKNADMQSAINKVQATQPSTDNPSQDGKRYLQSGYNAARDWLVTGGNFAEKPLNDGPQNHSKTKVFGHPIFNYEEGQRSGPVKTYLQAALKRPNFTFQTGTRVLRAIRVTDKITGVEVQAQGASTSSSICINDAGRVVFSAGALQSPQLLMWSGIGDAATLTRMEQKGFVTVPSTDWINNTAVGDKVFDNPNTFIELQSSAVSSYVYSYDSPIAFDKDLYLKSRSGPYTFGSQTSVFWDFIPQGDELVGCQGTIDSAGFHEYMDNGTITLNVYGTSGLRSTGRVNLDDRGIATPSLTFYSDSNDALAVATFIYNLFTALPASLTPLNVRKDSTVADIQKWITTGSPYTMGYAQHWSSSCRLGECVDVDARVKGTKNLFVVDASIVPPLTTNPVMGVMIAAERAVERILALKN